MDSDSSRRQARLDWMTLVKRNRLALFREGKQGTKYINLGWMRVHVVAETRWAFFECLLPTMPVDASFAL